MSKRYFEFVASGSSKFWEVTLDDTTQTVRFGKIGTEGQEKVTDFDESGKAKASTRKLIAEKTAKGYVEVGGRPPPQRNPQLELAIEKDLDAPAPYLAYAKWLQGKGDALGDFIVAQHRKPKDKVSLAKHREHLLGELAGSDLELRWHLGFLEEAGIIAFETKDGAEDLATLLELPVARFLQRLTLASFGNDGAMNLEDFVAVLDAKKAPRTLRSLELGNEGDWDLPGRGANVASLARLFPKLESLTLHQARAQFAKTLFPVMKRLTIGAGDKLKVKDLAPILSGAAFPSLEHLALINCQCVDKLIPALIESEVLPQLTSLELSKCMLGDDEVDALAAAASSFKHLLELNLTGNELSAENKTKVKKLARRVRV